MKALLDMARYHGDTLAALDSCESLMRAAERNGDSFLAGFYRAAYDALMAARVRLEQGA